MSSRFKVLLVNEGESQASGGNQEADTSKLVATHTESGDSTPTETKSLVASGTRVTESLKTLPSTEEVSKEPLVVDKAVVEESLKAEKPPPYSVKDPLMPIADNDESGGLVMKAAAVEDQPEETNAAGMSAAYKAGNSKGRFHVEFVDSKEENDDAQSPPLSPNHDSICNSVSHNTHSKTYYLRTFGHNTQEAIPMVAYYRNSSSISGQVRPSLDQLHSAKDTVESPIHASPPEPPVQPDLETGTSTTSAPIKFGWIKGVLIRCLLNIWGVILFLRLSWVVGQAGIGLSLVIIMLSGVVTVITTLSMSAICTNGLVRGGGAYYLISRSLGPEFGGAIGLIFSLANAVAVAMYVVGFAETVVELMMDHNATITNDMLHDTRIIGTITVILLLGITQLGMAWEAKAQIGLLVILLISIVNFIVGTFIPATKEKQSYGFFNYQGTIANENFMPAFTEKEGFFSVFSIFFPAATGILAGCNISGDLKDAQKAIPKGTLLAIVITSIVYCILAVMLGCIEVRAATGNVTDFIGSNITEMMNCTTASCELGWNFQPKPGCTGTECYNGGLLFDAQTMEKISGFGPIITAGIFAATLSSALASLVSAPKIFQAVCRDKIFPGIEFFGKGTPGSDEPRRGYALAFIIALGFILIGQLNAIAPIISNFFLASYALINYSCFAASLSKAPGWRPAFKYYNMWLSLLGALICCGVMFVINWWAALISILVIMALYKFVHYKKPDVNWGSSTQAYMYIQALNSALKLSSVEDHVKNFRPQTLVLSGSPIHRPALVHFASQFTKNVSLMVCANVIHSQTKNPIKHFSKQKISNEVWLKQQKIKSFYTSVVAESLKAGASSLMQSTGMGKLRTNTLLLGFKRDWKEDSKENLIDYVNIIHNAFDLKYGVCILRLKEGLDISQYLEATTPETEQRVVRSDSLYPVPSSSDFSVVNQQEISQAASVEPEYPSGADLQQSASQVQLPSDGISRSSSKISQAKDKINPADVDPQKLKALSQFQGKQEKGKTIDVWWLFDDGGLIILLPYLLSIKQQWSGCSLRVFTGGKQSRIDQDKRTMAQLLSKFRIDFKDVIVIGDIGLKPKKQSVKEFEDMIKPLRMFDGDMSEEQREEAKKENPWKITDDELEVFKEKTNRQIRLKELLQQHSKDAALVVMTLPMARKGTCSPGLYMAWLEELSRDMPPILLMRGNQTSVLTFYS